MISFGLVDCQSITGFITQIQQWDILLLSPEKKNEERIYDGLTAYYFISTVKHFSTFFQSEEFVGADKNRHHTISKDLSYERPKAIQ